MTTISSVGIGSTSQTTVGALSVGSLTTGFTPVNVAQGGTGVATLTTPYGVLTAGTTATGPVQTLAALGAAGTVLTSNGPAALPSFQVAAASGANVTKAIHQVGHGFSVGNVVYLNGATYTLAEANAVGTAEVIGVVSVVSGLDDFTLLVEGYVTGLAGLVAGTVYFLSDATPGLLTATEPSTVGNVSVPLLVADSTTSGYFHRYRGKIIPTTITYPLSLANGGTNANLTAANNSLVYSTASAFALLAPVNSAVLTTSSTGTLTWAGVVDQTTASATLAANNVYIVDNGASLVTFTLPATAALGESYEIVGKSSGLWTIAQVAGQTIHYGNVHTTTGVGGSLSALIDNDCVKLRCITANTDFAVVSSTGNLKFI